jgi:hypothetical protein
MQFALSKSFKENNVKQKRMFWLLAAMTLVSMLAACAARRQPQHQPQQPLPKHLQPTPHPIHGRSHQDRNRCLLHPTPPGMAHHWSQGKKANSCCGAGDLNNGGIVGVNKGIEEAVAVIGWKVQTIDGSNLAGQTGL